MAQIELNLVTKQRFIEHVRSKGDMPIKHEADDPKSSQWCNCAVGTFFTELTGDRLLMNSVKKHFLYKLEQELGVDMINYMGNSLPETYDMLLDQLT